MSAYRSEQLVTYVAGPFSVFVGMWIAGSAIGDLVPSQAHRQLGTAMAVTGLLSALALIAYGIYVLREGRRRLASDHWRAEHFMP
ncbi:hypothetical protein HY634_00760 [Candidatus Uhrbacteria bacterium]|nr:hypothetical protein [Candidatus Uhrbacteria bacterium]